MYYSLKITLLGILLFLAYKQPVNKIEGQGETDVYTAELAIALQRWIDARVAKSKKRLLNTKAGHIVWKAMEAHGGLRHWYMNGPLSFRFQYLPRDGSSPRDTYQLIDTARCSKTL